MGLFNKPLFRLLATTSDLKIFSLEKRKEMIAQYLESINLSQGLSGTDSFDTYQQNRTRQLDDLLAVKDAPKDKDEKEGKPTLKGPYWDKLRKEDNPHTQAVRTGIANALADTDALVGNDELNGNIGAVTQFNKDLKDINIRLENPPVGGSQAEITAYNNLIQNLPGVLHAAKLDAVNAIKAHQTQAKENIKDLFNDGDYVNHLKAGMGLTDDAQVDRIKKEMLSTLEKEQKAELAQFEKSFNEGITDIHSAIQRERDRIAYIGAMRQHNDKTFQNAVNALAKQNQPANRPGAILSTDAQGSSSLKNVNMDDLKDVYKTITGRKINVAPDGTFSLNLPGIIGGVIYYNRRHQYVDYDLQSLAEAVRACGHDSVTIEINGVKDPKEADELAKKMYEACINAGFDPEKIAVKIGGEERKLKSTQDKNGKEIPGLFSGDSTRFQRTERIAKALKEEREKDLKEPKVASDIAKYRAQLTEYRNQPAVEPEPQQQQQVP